MNNLVAQVLSKVAKFLIFLPKTALRIVLAIAKLLVEDPRKLVGFLCFVAIVVVSRVLVHRANVQRHQMLQRQRNTSEYQSLVAQLISDAQNQHESPQSDRFDKYLQSL